MQSEAGRLVGLLPIEQARAELARKGQEQDEKAVRRIASELGAQMLAARTRDLMRFRAGDLPAGNEFAGKDIAVEVDGGRVRVRTVVKKVATTAKRSGRSSRSNGVSPRLSSSLKSARRGGWFEEAALSSTARSRVPMH